MPVNTDVQVIKSKHAASEKKRKFTRRNNAQPLIVILYFVISPAAQYVMFIHPLTPQASTFCDGGQTMDVVGAVPE